MGTKHSLKNHFWRLATGLLLCAITSTQTGCSFNFCGLGFSGQQSGNCGCASSYVANSTTNVDSYSNYSYPDGREVGKQYALRYDIINEIRPNASLPSDLRNANLGQAFENGCRDGINEVVQLRISGELLAETNEEQSTPDYSDSDPYQSQNFDQSSEINLEPESFITEKTQQVIDMDSTVRNLKPMNKLQAANRIGGAPLLEARPLDGEQQALAEKLFEESQLAAPPTSQPLLLKATTLDLQSLGQTPSQTANSLEAVGDRELGSEPLDDLGESLLDQTHDIVLSASDVSKDRLDISDFSNLKKNTPDLIEDFVRSPAAPLLSSQNLRDAQVKQQAVIKLTAIPVYRINNQASNRKNSPAAETVVIPPVQPPADAIKQPADATKQPEPGAPVKQKKQVSVLVDHLDGIRIELDPIPVLRASIEEPQDVGPSESRFINSSHRTPANVLIDESTEVAPPTAPPIGQPAPASGPVDAIELKPEGYRLPATGPNLDELLRSPFNSNEAKPNSSQFEPRQAEPDNGKVYR